MTEMDRRDAAAGNSAATQLLAAAEGGVLGMNNGVGGKHKLTGPEMTIDELPTLVPVNRWPTAGGNGCFRMDCDDCYDMPPDRAKTKHRVIYERRMFDGECLMTSGLASLLTTHMFTSQNDGFYNGYVKSWSGRYRTWEEFTCAFYSEHGHD
jgi:hypothetical protein